MGRLGHFKVSRSAVSSIPAGTDQRQLYVDSTMESGSLVQQLVMVPLAEDHATTSSIETNRMLMVSGSLILNSIGDVSTALFDGQYWYPYLTSLTSTGSAGFASALFYSQSSFSFSSHRECEPIPSI